MVFSKYIFVMTKKILLFAFLILSFVSTAQKAQKIGYIDMEYILENIPEYQEALKKINAKSIMGIITLGASYKTDIIVSAEGCDENEAVDAISALFEKKFEEE